MFRFTYFNDLIKLIGKARKEFNLCLYL